MGGLGALGLGLMLVGICCGSLSVVFFDQGSR